MLRGLFVSLALAAPLCAQFSVVSAASYRAVIAPDSLASMFGTGLARSTASATLDANGNLPTELANTRVEVNSTAAALIFVSPSQINFVVPAGTTTGAASVTVRFTDTNATRVGTVQVAATAPALFSSDASGGGPGAILNAVTFQSAPFLTVTPENGADARTRLAVYGTGFRNAKSATARARDPLGRTYDLVVEFVGAAPGFAGLDQLNIIVPAAVDGASSVSLTITTEDDTSNAVTFTMDLLPLNQLQLIGISLNPAVVNAVDTITATLFLNGIARTGGFAISLRSSNLAAQPPSFATVPQGTASLDVPIPTSEVISVQAGTIFAQAGGNTVSANFEVDPRNQVQMSAFSVTPISTLGGRTLQGMITLSGTAPASGFSIRIASDNPVAQPPAVVAVQFSKTSVTFPIPTVMVAGPQPVTFTATADRVSLTSAVTIQPFFTLSLNPASVVGGNTATGSITLAEPAPPGGITILLTSTDAASARVPLFVTINAGLNFNTFTIQTPQVTGSRTVTITATYQGLTANAPFTVNAPPAPTLSSLTISPDHIIGGQSTQGTVTLAAPAPVGGILVGLTSSALNIAQVPPSIVVQQGFTTAIFTVNTIRVPVAEAATITASSGGIIRSAVVTVQ
jgi:uncharacterized protein (TIGR03437 family)